MKKLIVNADDFGLSQRINGGILCAHTAGILTSTSIMANGASFAHAISLCKSAPSLDVGIHLTLVEEFPLLDSARVASLVNKEGRFHCHATEFIRRYLTGRICFHEVRQELEAQIVKVKSREITISHLDSHQHLHMLPGILKIVVQLCEEYDIPAIRFPREIIRFSMLRHMSLIPRVLQSMTLNVCCHLSGETDYVRTDHFAGFLFGGNLNKKNLRVVLQQLPTNGTCELMCHPGFEDPETPYSHWKYHWSHELSALTDPDISGFVERRGIQLISYRHLAPN